MGHHSLPPGPRAPHWAKVIDELRADHAHAARLLEVLAERVSAADAGMSPDYALMLDVMHYMTHYPDHFHHPREELLLEKMVKRDPTVRGQLETLRAEHEALANKGARLLQTLRSLIDGVALRSDTLRVRCEDYVETLRAHMRAEEESIFPRAQELLGEQDWKEIEEQLSAREDPLFGRTLKREYDNLYRHVVSR